MDEQDPDRGRNGRFTKGNQGGPGRPRGSGNALRRAAEEAVTPEHVAAIIRRATRMALEGDVTAMRIVLDRVCGDRRYKLRFGPPEPQGHHDHPRLRARQPATAALGTLAID